ncbi:MAG TPA: Sec-independent protein translocase protein TatB [Burkholderiaceae bacterium]|jgi:sec-independent protein translocase protein TatB|nr:Sec-independent protein translocase protein TatB [Burkholderiaceae bacterium]
MFDFSLGELGLIGVVALIVLGPERLPKVARTVGEWMGKAQRYVSQVKADINREMELAELKKLQEEARAAAQSLQSSVQELQSDLNRATAELSTPAVDGGGTAPAAASDYAFEGATETWHGRTFPRRYKLGPSVEELAEEIARLKRELALPDAYAPTRRKYAPRSRLNRPRIRR